MNTPLDPILDRITMYRLVLYVLSGLLGLSVVLAGVGLLPFSPLSLLVSIAFLVLACWSADNILSRILGVTTNIESSLITALILALLLDPVRSPDDLQLLGWAALLAMASKYLLGFNNKHIFNPAALAVVVTAFALHADASWWVGTRSMLPAVLLGGLLIVRKLRQEMLFASFLAGALVTVVVVSTLQSLPVARELEQLLVASPLFFVATVMLTEPISLPPTRKLRIVYGLLAGLLIVPQVHVGPIFSTPELALVAANIFSFAVSPKQRVLLKLRRRSTIGADILDFAFTPSQPLAFAPGQYLEMTLGSRRADRRGNRRYFTIASSPTEDSVRFGVRFYQPGSTFKQALRTLDSRTSVFAGQVAGDFTLPRDPKQKLAFLAGGIGITPYRSMLKYLLDTRQQRDIVLIYANRRANEIAYGDVLRAAQETLSAKVLYTLTDLAAIPQQWNGLRGRITEEMVHQAIPDFHERTFYLSGPPAMVTNYERVLKNLGVPRRQIKRDYFAGLV